MSVNDLDLILWKFGCHQADLTREWDEQFVDPEPFKKRLRDTSKRIAEGFKLTYGFYEFFSQVKDVGRTFSGLSHAEQEKLIRHTIEAILNLPLEGKHEESNEAKLNKLAQTVDLLKQPLKDYIHQRARGFSEIVEAAVRPPINLTPLNTSPPSQPHPKQTIQPGKTTVRSAVSGSPPRPPSSPATSSGRLSPAPHATPPLPAASMSPAAAPKAPIPPAPIPKPVPPTPLAPAPKPAAAATWKELPLPDNEPDYHEASECHAMVSPSEMRVIGARVRGKKHKHEGTHCDDWFEMAVSGDWTILAVADGAGSKKFSRVGSQAACLGAVGYLTKQLSEHKIRERSAWTAETFQEVDLSQVSSFMVEAVQTAWQAVVKAAEDRIDSENHKRVLGRALNLGDLSTTLLLAVHTTVIRNGNPASLVFSCAVGDGMIAGIGHQGETRALMVADSGAHSGETRFLDERETAPDKLKTRIAPFLGSLRALLLMTDGVADDYFPNDPGMSTLYGDLLLNGIITSDIAFGPKSDVANQAAVNITEETFMTRTTRFNSRGEEHTVIRSIKAIAEKLGKTPTEVWMDPQLLENFLLGDPICSSLAPEERLRVWLDNYQVRGSFDDRTLIAMYR